MKAVDELIKEAIEILDSDREMPEYFEVIPEVVVNHYESKSIATGNLLTNLGYVMGYVDVKMREQNEY
jgi:hypothetical protein